MKEELKNSKVVRYGLISGLVVIVLTLITLGGYYLILNQDLGEAEKKDPVTSQDSQYPEETIIEKTDDENTVRITPSKEDSIQVKNADGEYTEIPKPIAPPPPPAE